MAESQNGDFKEKISAWLTPILLSIVGFFVLQMVNDLRRLRDNQTETVNAQVRMNAELRYLNKKMEKLEDQIDRLREEQRLNR